MSKPNLLLFSGRLLPASETFVRAQGENIKTFTPYYGGARFVEGLSLPAERCCVVNSGGQLGKISEALFKLWGVAPQFYRKLKTLNPALIHAHFGPCGALALPIAHQLNVPLVVTFHGFDAMMTDEYARQDSISTKVYLKRRESLKHNAKQFIAVSAFIRSKLMAQGFPEDKIRVHHIGVNTEFFQADASIPREPVVLFVGRLTEKKGCEYLIRAMSLAQQQIEQAELVILGDGPLRQDLEELARQKLRRYRFLGFQPPDVVKDWMNRASILTVPSVTASNGDSEGLPMVVVEAQAMGLPIIGSIHAGIPEAVVHGETGFLFTERDWDAMAKYIVELLSYPDLWKQMSMNGQIRMRKHFDLAQQTAILETIYRSVLEDI